MALKRSKGERAGEPERRGPGRAKRARAAMGPSRLAVVAVLVGLVGAVAMLMVPVDAAVGGDPLLRLRTFDAAPATAGTVDCGPALGEARSSQGTADLFGLARDRACRRAADRRMLSAGAASAIVLLTGLLAVVASSGQARGPRFA